MAETQAHPPIDPEVDAAWPAIVESGLTFTEVTADQIPTIRELFLQGLPDDEFLRRAGTIELEERSIPGPAGAPDVPALILRPAGRSGPLPCIYFTSNGGKILRSTRIVITQEELDWIVDLVVVMVSVAPRVRPEDPHPAQVEDAYAGLFWTAEHADELGIDPARILIMGKSGGGGIAAATALLARDRGAPRLPTRSWCTR